MLSTSTSPAFDAPVGSAPPRRVPAQPGADVRSPQAVSGISFVLPCFDEAENVGGAVAEAIAAGTRCAEDFEVIVVDDGSSDQTAAIVAAIVRSDRRVRLVVHAHNRGYGDAVRSGVDAAKMEWVFLTDADLQFDLRDLDAFLPHTTRADLIAGWRIRRQDAPHRLINAAAWNWLIRRAFQVQVRDVDCAFKLIRRELVQGCGLSCSGAMISTELVVKALTGGARLEEVGVHHRPRVAGRSSGAHPRVVMDAFRELALLRRTLRSPTPGAPG